MIRCFIALELPPEARKALEGVQRRLAPVGREVKWVRPEGIHLTLKFLGNIDEGQVEPVGRVVSEAAATCGGPLRLAMKGLGAFPGVARPRVVWVGLTGDTARLAALAQDLEKRLAPLGFAPEGRPFTPHLTLGRVKEFGAGRGRGRAGGKNPLSEAVVKLAALELGGFEARELILYRSELRPGGAVYTRLHAAGFSEKAE